MTVISRQESGRRGWVVMASRHSKAQRDAWARLGGRKPHLTYYQILEIEREQKASARLKSRSSSRGGSASAFDSTT